MSDPARRAGVSVPNTATTQELFNACAGHGGSERDHSAMVKALAYWRGKKWPEDALP